MCVCARVFVFKPGLQLLGDSLGFVPLLALDEDINRLFDEAHVQVEVSSLKHASTKKKRRELKRGRFAPRHGVCACLCVRVDPQR